MIRKFLENINNRKVIFEKFPQKLDEDCFCMEFYLPKSKKKSELIVKFKKFSDSIFPNITGDLSTDKSGNFIMTFEPFKIELCSSNDDNSSSIFLKWVDCFLENKPYSGGAEITFFILNNSKKNPIISLKGCSLNSVDCSSEFPTISIQFFAYQI